MNTDQTKRTALCAAIDIVLSIAAMAAAFFIRFVIFRGENPIGGFGYHMLWAALFSPVYVVLFGLLGVYSPQPQRGFIHAFGNIFLGCTFGVMLYIDLVFVFRVVDFSRWMILLFYILLIVFTGARGFVSHRLLRARYRAGKGTRRLVIIGEGKAAADFLRHVRENRDAGWTAVGSIGDSALADTPYLGGYDALRTVLERESPDEAVIAPDEHEAEKLTAILRQCENTGVKLALLPIGYECMSRHPYVEELCGLPLVNVRRVPLDNAGADIVKRLVDILGSLVLIVLTSPIMLAAAVGTRLSSPGPVFFTQERIGKDKKPFKMLKFRSMRVNAQSDTAWTRDHDPRRTAWGAFMRRYSIDELPQLFNVLAGDMSLVGPRPEIPRYVDHFKYSIPLYMVRHQVRPGITGWAQVNGLRGDTSIQSRVDYDLYYIENWSLFFDIKILLMTPFKGIVNHQESLK